GSTALSPPDPRERTLPGERQGKTGCPRNPECEPRGVLDRARRGFIISITSPEVSPPHTQSSEPQNPADLPGCDPLAPDVGRGRSRTGSCATRGTPGRAVRPRSTRDRRRI